MRAGLLRRKVAIQKLVEVKDPLSGELKKDWADFATVWGSIEDLAGREFFDAQQVNSEITTRVKIRYRKDIKATMRIICDDRVLEIAAPPIDPDGRKRELYLLCKGVS
ncbi:MAG: phage head closure protein [Firmicutes bacterium]|nr:phage head closure protein [Bacillota bacterium]